MTSQPLGRRMYASYPLMIFNFSPPTICALFFFNDTATTEIYTLSLHDALPISARRNGPTGESFVPPAARKRLRSWRSDRKSTRLNSSHQIISYAVFCLKKKKASEADYTP